MLRRASVTPPSSPTPSATAATPAPGTPARPAWRRAAAVPVLAFAALASACGGGGDGGDIVTGGDCSLGAQKSWLYGEMVDNYYFYRRIPSVNPAAYGDMASYFDALLNPDLDGSGRYIDRWSYVQDTASYSQFFDAGQTMDYGLRLAGRAEDPVPVRVRHVVPGSPAALAGLARGMVIDRINGVDAAVLKAAGDFSVLSPSTTGVLMTLQVRDGVGASTAREVPLRSAVYDLAPVTNTQVLSSPGGAKVGYLNFTEFVDAALTPLDNAFRAFRSQGVTQLVLDLRYNGGGSVDVARRLASGIAGSWAQNQTFTLLSFNDKRQAENIRFRFDAALGPQALNLAKVYVLTGPRSCSASEMVINGLKPFVDVVQIGGTTCGKPFGFQPVDHCGLTYSAVNFEAFNAVDGGRYYSGITPRCAVADDVDRPLGHPAEAMTAAALGHVDGGTCPVVAAKPVGADEATAVGTTGRPVRDGGPVPGMVLR